MPPPQCTRAALSAAPASGPAVASLAASLCTLQLGGSSRVTASAVPSVRSCRRHHSVLISSSSSSSTSCLFSRRPCLTYSPSHLPSFLSAAAFSTTTPCQSLKKRRAMRAWFEKAGAQYKPVKASRARASEGTDGSAGADVAGQPSPVMRPFPENPFFRSQPVLGESVRELVWEKVVRHGESIKAVAAELSIDMRRVAAVVRLKQIEKSWITEGKPLAKPYAQAVLAMLPQTDYGPRDAVQPHEPISEIHAHGYAAQQLFLPVPESRRFTRDAAAKAFHTTLLPADKRVPIPELITLERDVLTGARSPEDSFRAFRAKTAAEHKAMMQRDRAAAAAEYARTTRAETKRFEFRIRDIDAEDVGKNGRSPKAVGWRYGVPFDDRKRGQIKIPTSVG